MFLPSICTVKLKESVCRGWCKKAGRPKTEDRSRESEAVAGFSPVEFASPGEYKLYIDKQINLEYILKITDRHI
jgi:hypothetical protein